MNPYSYQHEKMGEAIHYLMLPDVPFEKKLVAGMMEFEHAFHTSLPSDSGFNHFDTVADRKSTRLNSSHGYISYAVFCLKKKKIRAELIYVLLYYTIHVCTS